MMNRDWQAAREQRREEDDIQVRVALRSRRKTSHSWSSNSKMMASLTKFQSGFWPVLFKLLPVSTSASTSWQRKKSGSDADKRLATEVRILMTNMTMRWVTMTAIWKLFRTVMVKATPWTLAKLESARGERIVFKSHLTVTNIHLVQMALTLLNGPRWLWLKSASTWESTWKIGSRWTESSRCSGCTNSPTTSTSTPWTSPPINTQAIKSGTSED